MVYITYATSVKQSKPETMVRNYEDTVFKGIFATVVISPFAYFAFIKFKSARRFLSLSNKKLTPVHLYRRNGDKHFLIKKVDHYVSVEESFVIGNTVNTGGGVGMFTGNQFKDIVQKHEKTTMDINLNFKEIDNLKPTHFSENGVYVYDYDNVVSNGLTKTYTKYMDPDTTYMVEYKEYPDMNIVSILFQGTDFQEYMKNKHQWDMYKVYVMGVCISSIYGYVIKYF